MRVPQTPPSQEELWKEVAVDPQRLQTLYQLARENPSRDYLHWDELRHRKPPHDLTVKEWWFALRLQRSLYERRIPLKDTKGRAFLYHLVDPIPEHLHQIDLGAGGVVKMPDQVTQDEKNRFIVSSLIDEAITSSQLEGATATREVARKMLRSGRAPRDKSEKMILNNYLTMQRIRELRNTDLTPELVLELHSIVTEGTLDRSECAGRLRSSEEIVAVYDEYGQVLHAPPHAIELPARLQEMCRFAKGQIPEEFVHPVLRSIILHFWLAYDHPFVDGNGRTARALFYWCMLRNGYWLCEFISISQAILKSIVQYGRAFLFTETDGNDLTYFLLYHFRVLRRAVEDLHRFIQRKTQEVSQLNRRLREHTSLNHRQKALLAHALRHPEADYTVESHRSSHDTVYETARKDLKELTEAGFLLERRHGKAFHYFPVTDLEERLS